jgi:hypothetical protein
MPAVIDMPSSKANDEVNGFSLSRYTDLPIIATKRNQEWVDFGADNLYPEFLKDMFNSSPTHQAIVKTKSQMIAGDGYTVNMDHLDEKQKIEAIKILQDIERSLHKTTLDSQIFGSFAYEIIWSLDFKKIVEVNRIDPAEIRSGKFEEGRVEEYYWSRDWDTNRPEFVEIPALDKSNKEDHRQLIYTPMQMVSNEYYGDPSYLGAIDWVTLESQTGLYYRSLIENGFNPSVIIKFFRKPTSLEERSDIVNGLKKSFGGVKNSGKAVVLFSDGKELAPEISPIEVASVDKQFTVIATQITEKIITGHQVTTSELFGVNVPGQLGSGDFDVKVKAFNKFVISPAQRRIEHTINDILRLNGFDINYKIIPFTL